MFYTRHTSNFKVLCPNKILGIGQRKAELPIEDAKELPATWGSDPVHPSPFTCHVIAEEIVRDLGNPEAKYTKPTWNPGTTYKKPRLDLSLEQDAWISRVHCCPATWLQQKFPFCENKK
jgi:hypothetical protein